MFERRRDHPLKLGLLSGILFAAWAAAIYDSLLVGVVSGALLGLLQVFLWRPNGSARRFHARRLEQDRILRRRR